jgi:hypothetical protein
LGQSTNDFFLGNGDSFVNSTGTVFNEKYNNTTFHRSKYQKHHPFSLQSLIDECKDKHPEWSWKEQEWGFPKGRRDNQENDFICGLREFTEETGYFKNVPLSFLSLCVSKNGIWNEEKGKIRILSRNQSSNHIQEKTKFLSEKQYDDLVEYSLSTSDSHKEINNSRESQFELFTGISKMTAILNIFPFEENFIGSNYKPYKHKYYLMQMDYNDTVVEHQTSEVSHCAWKTYEECMEMFRFYNEEKKQMLTRIHRMLEHFDLY